MPRLHLTGESMWKQLIYFESRHDAGMKEKRGRREKEVTEQEAFDFFTATWEEEKKEETTGGKKDKKVTKSVEKEVSTSKGSEDEEEESEDEDEEGYETANEEEEGWSGDKKKLLASQYIGLEKAKR